MDESPEPSQNDDPSTSDPRPEVIAIAPKGDILLDVTFETSRSTLKATRKAAAAAAAAAAPKYVRPVQAQPPKQPPPKPQIRLAYRVDLATLKKHSRYFTNLLGDTRFEEARAITACFAALSLRGIDKPGEQVTDPAELPRVRIVDDDEATQSASASREKAFSDMLRILHGRDAITKPVTMLYVVTLAVKADRFACTTPLARYLSASLKFKWPATPSSRLRGEDGLSGLSLTAEEIVRQKVLVSWLLDQPMRFAASTREMVIFGSHRWSVKEDESDDEAEDPGADAAAARQEALWWYLPDGLEEELHHRRHLILRTLASIPSHFLTLYASRSKAGVAPMRQCKLGYDTSAACDSFQLGETVKFLVTKNLLFLTNFSPSSMAQIKDFAAVDVNSILSALKQCPQYQIDRNHTNCGMRTRLMPILEYVASMLSANVIPLTLQGWKKDQKRTSWATTTDNDVAPFDDGDVGSSRRENKKTSSSSSSSTVPTTAATTKKNSTSSSTKKKKDFVVPGVNTSNDNTHQHQRHSPQKGRVFFFTRSVASDQRLRYDGAMAVDKMARELFTADDWDWTPDEDIPPRLSTTPFLGLK